MLTVLGTSRGQARRQPTRSAGMAPPRDRAPPPTAAAIRVPRRLASTCLFSEVPRNRCGTVSQVKSQLAAAGGVHNRRLLWPYRRTLPTGARCRMTPARWDYIRVYTSENERVFALRLPTGFTATAITATPHSHRRPTHHLRQQPPNNTTSPIWPGLQKGPSRPPPIPPRALLPEKGGTPRLRRCRVCLQRRW